jgi:hypothetical protein
MFKMFAQFFSALTRLFSAAEHAAGSLDELAHAGELMAQSVKANAQFEHDHKAIEMDRKIAALKAQPLQIAA